MPVIIPVISASGGAGKTTISLLLAYMLTTHVGVDPKRVLLVDLDPTAGPSLRVFGDDKYDEICRDRRTLYHMDLDYGSKNIRIDDYVNFPGKLAEDISNVAVLPPGEDSMGDLSSRMDEWFKYARRERLVDLLEKAGAFTQYDYIIIDTAPFFDVRYTVVAASASETAVVPLKPTITDIMRTKRMLNALRKHGVSVNPVFIFNFDKDKLHKEAATLEHMGYKVPRTGGPVYPDQRLIAHVEELRGFGNVVNYAMAYYKELSDASFPRRREYKRERKPRYKVEDLACNPIVDLLRALGVNSPQCPAEVEIE